MDELTDKELRFLIEMLQWYAKKDAQSFYAASSAKRKNAQPLQNAYKPYSILDVFCGVSKEGNHQHDAANRRASHPASQPTATRLLLVLARPEPRHPLPTGHLLILLPAVPGMAPQAACREAGSAQQRKPGESMSSNPLAATTERAIPPGVAPHTCTCTFPAGEIAVVNVYGACDQQDAHSIVAWIWWPRCHYIVTDGDCTNGHAHPFTLLLDHAPLNRKDEPCATTE